MVDKYLNGIWINQREGNWAEDKAEEVAVNYRILADHGIRTMGDDV